MISIQRSSSLIFFAGLSLYCAVVNALEFEPGVGVGAEYTNNAELTPAEISSVDDLITIGYVGASLSENEGPLTYKATTSFNNQSYTQDTYPDQHYFNLGATADWEMIKDRFDWSLMNFFSQRTVNSLAANTPDNLQDSNIFTLGANIFFPISSRQAFTLSPSFSQYYYEVQLTDNKQYALSANWNYQMYRLTSIGLNLSNRIINYFEQDIADTTFTNLAFILNTQRSRSSASANLGATYVQREGGEGATGFAGSLNVRTNLTSRSEFNALLSTDLSDTSSVSAVSVEDPITGNPNDVQITTDVVRNSLFNLAYLREDGSLNSRAWLEYQKLRYSDSPLNREIRTFGVQLNYPVTQLVSAGTYINFNRTKELDTARIDENFIVGSSLNYRFTRKWHSLFDIKYRTKDSTDATENFNEFTVFASLVYGFGDVYRPSTVGGF